LSFWQAAEKLLLIHWRLWYKKTCVEKISGKITYSVIWRPARLEAWASAESFQPKDEKNPWAG
jgi:hypothetical protein